MRRFMFGYLNEERLRACFTAAPSRFSRVKIIQTLLMTALQGHTLSLLFLRVDSSRSTGMGCCQSWGQDIFLDWVRCWDVGGLHMSARALCHRRPPRTLFLSALLQFCREGNLCCMTLWVRMKTWGQSDATSISLLHQNCVITFSSGMYFSRVSQEFHTTIRSIQTRNTSMQREMRPKQKKPHRSRAKKFFGL